MNSASPQAMCDLLDDDLPYDPLDREDTRCILNLFDHEMMELYKVRNLVTAENIFLDEKELEELLVSDLRLAKKLRERAWALGRKRSTITLRKMCMGIASPTNVKKLLIGNEYAFAYLFKEAMSFSGLLNDTYKKSLEKIHEAVRDAEVLDDDGKIDDKTLKSIVSASKYVSEKMHGIQAQRLEIVSQNYTLKEERTSEDSRKRKLQEIADLQGAIDPELAGIMDVTMIEDILTDKIIEGQA